MYLYSNLKILKPGEKLSFQKTFDFLGFNDSKDYYNLYSLDSEKKYLFSLSYCIDENIYSSLTVEQKKAFKNYKFFTGNLVTNESIFEFSKEDLQK